jgi:hypothetical protein
MLLLAALVLLPQEELKPGLVGEYVYVGKPLEDFVRPDRDVGPRFKRVDRQIDFLREDERFAGTKLKDCFVVRWTGLVRIPKDGKWRFFTVSDDGSRLFVGGKRVVDNGGLHEMREASGEVELKAGDHELAVEYFENMAHAGIRIAWEGPGTGKDVIPASALFHKKSQAPTEEERKGIDREPPPPRQGDAPQAKKPETEERKPEPPKPVEPPKPDLLGPLDPRVIGQGEKAPDLAGRIVTAFEDGPSAMLTLRTRAGELAVFLESDTKRIYVGLERSEQRPAPTLQVYVWLKPGTADQALEVRIFKDARR